MKKKYIPLILLVFTIFYGCDNKQNDTLINQKDMLSSEEITAKKILFVLTSQYFLGESNIPTGYWLKEAAIPWLIFTEANIQVTFASPKGGLAPVDQNSYNYMDSLTRQVSRNPDFIAGVNNTTALSDIRSEDYDGVLYVGGHGPFWDFPENKDIDRITSDLYEAGKVVAAICHGPAALINVALSDGTSLIANHALTAITNEEEETFERTDLIPFFLETELISGGAEFTKVAPWEAHVETSGNLITGQNPASAEGVAQAMLKMIQNGQSKITENRFWKLMEDICEMGKFIVAVPNEGASANIIGKFMVEHDGRENVLQVIDNKDHVHIYPENVKRIEFNYLDVGYGPEPCIEFVNHSEFSFLKLYYMGGSASEKQQELLTKNSDLKAFFKGNW